MPELPTLKAVNSSAWVKAAGGTRNDFMAPGNSHDLIQQFHMRRGKGQIQINLKKSELQAELLHVRCFQWRWLIRSQLEEDP